MNSSLCRLNVQIARKSLCLIFDNLIVSYYISPIVAVNKEKSKISFKSCIKPSCPISEITTSHVCRLEDYKQEWSEIKYFSNQESEGAMSYIVGAKWLSGCN